MFTNLQDFQVFLMKRVKLLLSTAFLLIAFTVSVLSILHFRDSKRAKMSADIAVGIAYLEEGNKDIALYYFEKAFNLSEGFYGVLSGVGVIKSLKGKPDFTEKSKIIYNLIKDYKSPKFINMIILSNYLQNTSKEGIVDNASFKKFKDYASKNQVFKQNLEAVELNLAKSNLG
jgi:hypothetical protein